MLRFFLIESGFDLNASQTDKYNFIIEIAKGNLDFTGIKDCMVKLHPPTRVRQKRLSHKANRNTGLVDGFSLA